MSDRQEEWIRAIERSWIVRFPKQHLATFGISNIEYYVVTEPIYQDVDSDKKEGVVRTGKVISQKPAVVTPTYVMNVQGFSSEAYDYFRETARMVGPNSPGILYQYKNEVSKMDIVGGTPSQIAQKISEDLDSRKEDMSVVMVGVDELWDVALLKFIYEFTSSSIAGNVQEFQSRGMLEPQSEFGGVPRAVTQKINRMVSEVEHGADPDVLKHELDRWGLFKHYEDRFLNIFRQNR